MNRKHLTNPWVYSKIQNTTPTNEFDSDIEEEYFGNYSFITIEDGSKKMKTPTSKKKELQKEEFFNEN